MTDRHCIDCATSIERGKRCKPCQRIASVAAKREARRAAREANPMYCDICGQTLAPPKTGLQKYCPTCRPMVKTSWGREAAARNRAKAQNITVQELRAKQYVCVDCNAPLKIRREGCRCEPCARQHDKQLRHERTFAKRAQRHPVCRYCGVELATDNPYKLRVMCVACEPTAKAEQRARAREKYRAAHPPKVKPPRVPKPPAVKREAKPKPAPVPKPAPPLRVLPPRDGLNTVPFVTGDEDTAAARFAELMTRYG